MKEQGRKYFRFRILTQISKSGDPGPSGALSKLVYANTLQQGAALAMDIDGIAGVFAHFRTDQTRVFNDYLWAAAMRVAGGTDEILRNQLAERVLGMPGEIRVDKDVAFRDIKQ
ncbi:MAG: acyl-CoA dehydrogenase family protein [Rhizomicrobium sp.]